MKIEELAERVGPGGLFRTGQVVAGQGAIEGLRRQLDRWVKSGYVTRLRRGVYMLNRPYRETSAHPFAIANALNRGSYVSLQSVLAYNGVIPEYTPVTTSVTTGRPEEIETPVGRFQFRHIAKPLFCWFEEAEVASDQYAFVARPEKALIDLLYLTPRSDESAYLRELRLDPSAGLDLTELNQIADSLSSRKVRRAVDELIGMLEGKQK